MRLSLIQMQPAPADPEANLATIEAAVRAAAAAGASVLVAPEMAVTGYAIWDDVARLAEPRTGPSLARLSRLAAETGVTVVAGFPERDGDTVYNAVAVAAPDGALRVYRKCHLFGPHEKAAFSPGSALSPLFEVAGLQTGLLICYDLEFPETARSLALAGAQLLLVATALPRSGPNDRVSRAMVPARALENQVVIVYAGLCGCENGQAYQGGSAIVGPDGEDLARAGSRPALLVADVTMGVYPNGEPDPYLEDRRPEIYQVGAQLADRTPRSA